MAATPSYADLLNQLNQLKNENRNLKKELKGFHNLAIKGDEVIYLISLPDVKYEYVSPNIERLFGITPEELRDKPLLIRELIHPDWIEYFKREWEAVLNGDIPPVNEYPIILKDGQEKWVHQQNLAIKNEKDEITAVEIKVSDITQQKKTREELKKSEKRYRDLFERSIDGFIILNSEGRILEVNPSFCEMTAYTNKELKKSKDFFDFTGSKNWKSEVIFSEVKEKGYSKLFEKNWVRKDGKKIPVEIRFYSLTDHESEPETECCWAIVRNLSEKKKNLRELSNSEKKFRSFFNNINIGTSYSRIITDKNKKPIDFVFLDVNTTFEKITNLKKEEIINKRGKEVIPSLEQKWINKFGKVALTGEPEVITDHSKYMDRYWEVKIFSPGKNQFASAIQDVTEKVRFEKALKESEKTFRSIVQSSPMGIHIYHLDKKENLIFKGYNEAANRQVGIDCKQFLDKTMEEAFPALSKTELPHRYRKIALEGGAWNTEQINYSDDNIIGAFEVSVFQMSPGKIAVFFHNITERKITEEELKKAKIRAEESDRLKSVFLANMSHEIRTPMNGILGFADLLKEPSLSDEKQIDYIEIIEKSGRRMLGIINDLIDISKIEAGQIEVNKSGVNINNMFSEIYSFFLPEVKAKNLEFKLNPFPESRELIITSDSDKISAILINLIKNAIKYTHKGKIEFGYARKSNMLEFYVKDTGIGIEKDRQKAIFDRFVQETQEVSKNYEGAGLGLAITKAYVDMLGGNIWLESRKGSGSSFYVSIPCNDSKKRENPETISSDNGSLNDPIKNLKVLIVEDDDVSDLYLTELLSGNCKELIHAKTGYEAINKTRNNPDLDLIFMDIRLPELNGYKATREIRKFNKDVVIVAQTAYAMEEDRVHALNAGCNDYLAKPLNIKQISEMLAFHFNLD